MQKYTMKGNSSIDQLTKDVDLELIPKIIEKVVLIKIDRMYILTSKKCMLTFKIKFFFLIYRNGYKSVGSIVIKTNKTYL